MHRNVMALFAAGKGRSISAYPFHSAIGLPRTNRAAGNARLHPSQPALPREECGFFGALPAHPGSAVFSRHRR